MKGIIKNTEGAAAVEFGLIAIILFAVIFGIIEFGFLLYNNSMLTHASRVAAREGVLYAYREDAEGNYYTHQDDPTILRIAETYWRDNFITFGDSSTAFKEPIVERCRPGADGCTPVTYGAEHRNDLLTVTLTYEYDFLFLRMFGIGPITLQAETTMIFE